PLPQPFGWSDGRFNRGCATHPHAVRNMAVLSILPIFPILIMIYFASFLVRCKSGWRLLVKYMNLFFEDGIAGFFCGGLLDYLCIYAQVFYDLVKVLQARGWV